MVQFRSWKRAGNRQRLLLLHGRPNSSEDENIEAVMRSKDARDWFLSRQDVSNINARFLACQWKRSARDVESVFLWVRADCNALALNISS